MTIAYTPLVAILYRVQRGLCFHCLGKMKNRPVTNRTGKGWTREHVVPRSAGGKRARNIVLAHYRCNYERGTKPLDAIDMRRARLIVTAAAIGHERQFVGEKR